MTARPARWALLAASVLAATALGAACRRADGGGLQRDAAKVTAPAPEVDEGVFGRGRLPDVNVEVEHGRLPGLGPTPPPADEGDEARSGSAS